MKWKKTSWRPFSVVNYFKIKEPPEKYNSTYYFPTVENYCHAAQRLST